MKIYKGEVDGQRQRVRVKVPHNLPSVLWVILTFSKLSNTVCRPLLFYHCLCVLCVLTSFGLQLTPSHSRQSGVAPAGDSDSDGDEQLDEERIEMQDLSHPHVPADPMERDSAESLAFHDPTHVQLTLQVLGLMCDGQNRNLQVTYTVQATKILAFYSNGTVIVYA